MKTILILFLMLWSSVGLSQISGAVYQARTKKPLPGATVGFKRHSHRTSSDSNGRFRIPIVPVADTLILRHLGYVDYKVFIAPGIDSIPLILMEEESSNLQEIAINTGYYQVPQERATGSFAHMDNKLLNRGTGGNILERLEGIAPGVQFVNPGGGGAADIRIRGLSTIESDETPLIILDNFPYESSLDNLDPNDIESVTVLRDAAAASIWGARAGNGVIVITSKKGKRDGEVRVSININGGVADKPDLIYSRSWLPSETVMEIEKYRFGLGHYAFEERTSVPMYAELLKAYEDGILSKADLEMEESVLRSTDTRKEAMDYLYRRSGFRQLAANISGGSEKYGFAITTGYHGAIGEVVGENDRRYTIGMRNDFRPFPGFEIGLGLAYAATSSDQNGINFNDLSVVNMGVSPYYRLVGEDGDALAINRNNLSYAYAKQASSNDLLDWEYRPIEDRNLMDSRSSSGELRLNVELKAKVVGALSAKGSYQFVQGHDEEMTHYFKNSFHARNLVNMFTQMDGSRIIPHNGILLTGNPQQRSSHFGRFQLDYNKTFEEKHRINALGGVEIRHGQSEIFPASVLYNYNDQYLTGANLYNFNQSYPTLPSGAARIPNASSLRRKIVHRDLSYFTNVSYELDNKYVASGSLRWDGSNLFGVKTNQKGLPLWSLGASWNVSNEHFYGMRGWMEYLRIRSTYGVSGNMNKTITHHPTIRFSNSLVNLSQAFLTSVGNPSLRWEQVGTLNIGVDWSILRKRLSGTFEYYVKNGRDLIGDDYMDPTTGLSGDYKINYADMRTKGWDLQLISKNIASGKGFNWESQVLASLVRNTITNYRTNEVQSMTYYLNDAMRPPILDASRDVLLALPWNGLSPENGYPLIFMDEIPSQDYRTYHNSYLTLDKLMRAGVSVPTLYGSLRNTFSWKQFEVGFMFTWKAGHVFRRSSMLPGGEFSENYHQDYFKRWEKPGDENITDVPAYVPMDQMSHYPFIGVMYRASEALITSGDHIRFQDMNISYTVSDSFLKKTPVKVLNVYAYARNLGILWQRDKVGGDPDYPESLFRAPAIYSLGVRMNF